MADKLLRYDDVAFDLKNYLRADGYHYVTFRLPLLPAVDVVGVRHAKWKLLSGGRGECPICGRVHECVWDYDNADNYCRHCGSRMDGGGQDG